MFSSFFPNLLEHKYLQSSEKGAISKTTDKTINLKGSSFGD